MDYEELDHIPIRVEAYLRDEFLFSLNIPVSRLNQAGIQAVFLEAITQLMDPVVLQGISREILRIIEESQN